MTERRKCIYNGIEGMNAIELQPKKTWPKMSSNSTTGYLHTSHETAVSKDLCTIAVKHWETAGVRFGVFRYSKTQLKALLEADTLESPLRIPPLLIKRMISNNATASK